MHQQEQLDFSRVTTFNLDEYVGLDSNHEQSYHSFMWKNLFSQININSGNVHIPNGMARDVPAICANYDRKITAVGCIDLQVLGI